MCVQIIKLTICSDLDGDDYWITWDPRLIPKEVFPYRDRSKPPPKTTVRTVSTRIQSQDLLEFKNLSIGATKLRDIRDMSKDAVQTFVDARGGILGRLSTDWMNIVTRLNGLGCHPYALALSGLIENALVSVTSLPIISS